MLLTDVSRQAPDAAPRVRRRPGRTRRPAATTPGRVRAGAVAIGVAACGLGLVIAVVFGSLSSGIRSIGSRDAPEVDASTGLFFSLNDMDAQVANVLLVGSDRALAAGRAQDLAIYQQDRKTADRDLQQAAVVAAGDASAQRALRSVLDGLGGYEALAADAILTDQQAGSAPERPAPERPAPGRPPAVSLMYYRQATDLMSTSILPQVSALTGINSGTLDAAYQAKRSDALTGIWLVAALGAVLLASVAGLQIYLAARYRRLLSPALAAATLAGLGLVIAGSAQLAAEAGHLRVAKVEAFDSISALTQARAVSYDANADESRYLVDPGRAARYQQAFLTKLQRLADVGNVGIFQYDAALAADIRAYQANHADVRFGGYLGAEFRNITFPGERAAAERALADYQVYERDDRTLRAMAKTNLLAAVEFDTGTAPGQSDWAFNQYSAALTSVITINHDAFSRAVQAGQAGTSGWTGVFPAAGVLLIVVLTVIGVRPRLAEYR